MIDPSSAVEVAVRMSREFPATDLRRLASALLTPHGIKVLHATAGLRVRDACTELAELAPHEASRALIAGAILGSLEHDPRASRVTPVWTGPSTGTATRLTSAAVVDLIGRATAHILLVGYAVHNEPTVTQAMQDATNRGVSVTLVVERSLDNPSFTGGNRPFPSLDAIRLHWPNFARPAGASLHAKLLVIDDTEALVGSANVTGAALGKNLECGLLVRGGSAARKLRDHVEALLREGALVSL